MFMTDNVYDRMEASDQMWNKNLTCPLAAMFMTDNVYDRMEASDQMWAKVMRVPFVPNHILEECMF